MFPDTALYTFSRCLRRVDAPNLPRRLKKKNIKHQTSNIRYSELSAECHQSRSKRGSRNAAISDTYFCCGNKTFRRGYTQAPNVVGDEKGLSNPRNKRNICVGGVLTAPPLVGYLVTALTHWWVATGPVGRTPRHFLQCLSTGVRVGTAVMTPDTSSSPERASPRNEIRKISGSG